MNNCTESGYIVGPKVTVDETIVGFDGRVCFKTYNPGKSTKRGIKIWSAVDPVSHYYFNGDVYLGKKHTPIPESNLGEEAMALALAFLLIKNI
jgi:hypothetical protein